MSKTRKKKNKTSDALLRGLIAVSMGAALLACALFLIAPKPGRSGHETEPPREIAPGVTQPANPYGPEDFEYEGDYLACTAGSALLGVDVSSHQGAIDWEQVRDAGMEFAIIRLGYRGYTSGGVYEDEYALANLAGAKAAGLKVGVYFYSQALDEGEALREAQFCIDLLDGMTLEELGEDLLQTVLRIASGEKTRSEANGFHDLAIFKQGVTL